ncbi:MAG: aromatic aminobenezylarsenical efflux permease ArsG family transporter [Marinilabiliaceae bacterium]|jgi:cytochrome c biogenesis protein CcdA|nr:aromatic aminobenezylarsenical efflux permease ArsG family transporter [Marinilabiliaceae bacterium]
MDEILNNILGTSSLPVVSAFVLGLMTAISPCPLATNITAIGYISREVESRNRVFLRGLLYTLGRAIAYTALAFILYIGADQLKISGIFQQYGEKIIGPLLFFIGFMMLGIVRINIPLFDSLFKKEDRRVRSGFDVLFLGIIFALAFCPYSGVLYFGMLIPMSITSASGLLLPAVFALATGLPVIIIAWLLAYTVSGVGTLYNRLKVFEYWFRRIVAVLFMGVGIYYIIVIFL